jgi:hypothetical protein
LIYYITMSDTFMAVLAVLQAIFCVLMLIFILGFTEMSKEVGLYKYVRGDVVVSFLIFSIGLYNGYSLFKCSTSSSESQSHS